MLQKITELLGEELSKQVQEKLGDVELGITNDGTLVSAEKHDSMKAEFKATKESYEKIQQDLKEFESKDSTIEELKKKLEESNSEYEKFKAETETREVVRTKQSALSKLLAKEGALESSIDLLIGTINVDDVQIDKQGNIVDSDSVINPIKESRKGLFTEVNIDDKKPNEGDNKPDNENLSDQEYFDLAMKK